MAGWKKFGLFILFFAALLIFKCEPSAAQQTSIQLHCSLQADARGLHGAERKAFRSRCQAGTSPLAAHRTRTPKNLPASVSRDRNRFETKESSKSNLAKSDFQGTTQEPAAAVAVAPLGQSPEIEHRIALVIGNSAYKNVPSLTNPQRDAELVAAALKRTGFESVTLKTNLGRDQLVGALRAFAVEAEKSDWAVIYYAGHGMEVGGINYLIPIDATISSDRDMSFEAIPLDQVLNVAERARKLRLVVLDACRDNPFTARIKRTMSVASRSVSRGLVSVEPDPGTLVVFAAKDGEVALDGDGDNSPFATAFVKDVQVKGLEVRRLFDTVRDDVLEMTNGRQKPFSYGSVSGRQDFYFVQK